jgi:hypothetical protein
MSIIYAESAFEDRRTLAARSDHECCDIDDYCVDAPGCMLRKAGERMACDPGRLYSGRGESFSPPAERGHHLVAWSCGVGILAVLALIGWGWL